MTWEAARTGPGPTVMVAWSRTSLRVLGSSTMGWPTVFSPLGVRAGMC